MRSDGGSTATVAGGAAAAVAMTGSVKKKSPSEPSSHCGTPAGTGGTPPPHPGIVGCRLRGSGLPGDLAQRVAYLAWLAQRRGQPPSYLLLPDRRLDLR